MSNSFIETDLFTEVYNTFNKKVERRTDFDTKATEPAEVVVVSDGGDCEELD
ncbi:unnamed protein product [Hymenolepis diminuta]|uniref:Uncharacterized protein n=1 Tax=Hymenolepis diminuta TaxID=6216 RepID=A0A564Y1E9_HYMDI|nr:unnamed protein product [Hymenolepis diminuta]